MAGNVGTGQQIVIIRASDNDLPAGSITYEIISVDYIRGAERISGTTNSTILSAFTIDSNTGKVSLLRALKPPHRSS